MTIATLWWVARNMRQGEIWLTNLDPTEGSEQSGRRPVVVISGDTLNDALPIVIVVPISSKVKSYPTCVRLGPSRVNGLKKGSEAIPFQVRTITKKRLIKRIVRISIHDVQAIIKGLLVTLTH